MKSYLTDSASIGLANSRKVDLCSAIILLYYSCISQCFEKLLLRSYNYTWNDDKLRDNMKCYLVTISRQQLTNESCTQAKSWPGAFQA